MKIAGYILSFYLLLLAVIPCCAFDSCQDVEESAEHITERHTGDEDSCGSCSPFFSCEGCATVSINEEPACFSLPGMMTRRIYSSFMPSFVASVHYDFWQPPRLG